MKRLSLGILMLISIAFCALLDGYSRPISVDDDVGDHVTIVMDDFQLPVFQDNTATSNDIRLNESRWNYPGASTFSVPTVSSEISYAQTYDFYMIRPARNDLSGEQPTIRLCNDHYRVVNTSTTANYGIEVLGIGELFASPDVK